MRITCDKHRIVRMSDEIKKPHGKSSRRVPKGLKLILKVNKAVLTFALLRVSERYECEGLLAITTLREK